MYLLPIYVAHERTAGRHDRTTPFLGGKAHVSADIEKSLFGSETHPEIRQKRTLHPKC
jgi:hypothetical protein